MSESMLKTSYDSEVRPLIDLIDRLRSLELDKEVNLPAVAVIGDQSAGKSSVLEAISGVQLPRGTGIVTRCPLMMRMKQLSHGQPWEGYIAFKSLDGKNKRFSIPCQDEVGKFVKKAQVDVTGNQKGISEELIELEVASPDVPDLTLIDLPGIARNAVEGQPEDIEERTKSLITKYIERETTIILAVLQCTIDPAVCGAIKMARIYDKDGSRTLGVLTMPDRVEAGAEEQVMKLIANTICPLKKGYIMVKCRSQNEVKRKKTLTDALADEQSFFVNHEQFRTLPLSQRGIGRLSIRLAEELKSHIQKLLPALHNEVEQKLNNTTMMLQRYGRCPANETEKRLEANELVSQFSKALDCLVKGEAVADGNVPGLVLSKARNAYRKFHEQAENNKPKQQDLEAAIKYDLDVGRGLELPEYTAKFAYVEKYAKIYLEKLIEPAMACFDTVHTLMKEEYMKLVERFFSPYKGLYDKTVEMIAAKVQGIEHSGRLEIGRYLTIEKGFVFAQDSTYIDILEKEEKKGNPHSNDATKIGLHKIVTSLMSYYKVAMTRISDVIPLIIHEHLFREEVQVIITNLKIMVADNTILNVICEDPQVAQQRAVLHESYIRLSTAMKELSFTVMHNST